MDTMYKQAARTKLRFITSIGTLQVEDLWELSLEQLDVLAKRLHKSIKDAEEGSFITPAPKVDTRLECQFAIVKDVIADKLEEKAQRAIQKANAERKRAILNILASKEDETLKAKTKEELIAELEGL